MSISASHLMVAYCNSQLVTAMLWFKWQMCHVKLSPSSPHATAYF